MSLQKPFRLTVVTENGEEPFPYDTDYFDESPLELTLRDMYLGTAKEVTFRLYNEIPEEVAGYYNTVLVNFDLSESFTFADGVRYDTLFGNSLRDFLKIYLKIGPIGSDNTSQNELEISSVFHANLDTPIVGIIFSSDNDTYSSASLNTYLTNKYLIVPYFPNPGEFVSFTIGIKIPNKFTEDFLVKALGFPGKQGVYKTPISSPAFLKSVQELQIQNLIGGSAQHQKLIGIVGPVGLNEFNLGNPQIEFAEGMLGRVASRGYLYNSSGLNVFSNVLQKNIFTDNLSYFTTSAFLPSYYNDGLPKTIAVNSSYDLVLAPSTSSRKTSYTLLELASLIPEALTYYERPGEQPQSEIAQIAQRVLDVGNYHTQRLITFTGTDKQDYYSYASGFSGNTLTSFENEVVNIGISALSHAFYALFYALPDIFPMYSALSRYYVINETCLTDYFDVVVEGQQVCDFRFRPSSIWSSHPNEIAANSTSMELLSSVLLSMSIVLSVVKNIKDNPNIEYSVKQTLDTQLSYFYDLSRNLAIFTIKHLAPYWDIINEVSQSGSGDIQIGSLDTSVFYAGVSLNAADFILEDYMSISKQFWTYLQKLYFYRGVYTNTTAMILTRTKPAQYLSDDVVGVLEDLDGPKTRRLAFLSNITEKEAEKLISLKMFVQSII